MIWRRKGRGGDPDQVLLDARDALNDLRSVLGAFRAHLDELEAEIRETEEA